MYNWSTTIREQEKGWAGAAFNATQRIKNIIIIISRLGGVGEVAELRLPHHQRVGVLHRVAQLEPQHRVPGEIIDSLESYERWLCVNE